MALVRRRFLIMAVSSSVTTFLSIFSSTPAPWPRRLSFWYLQKIHVQKSHRSILNHVLSCKWLVLKLPGAVSMETGLAEGILLAIWVSFL